MDTLGVKNAKMVQKYQKSITFIDKKSRRPIFSENLIKPMENEENQGILKKFRVGQEFLKNFSKIFQDGSSILKNF